tara:strand:+ start:265 stop:756 length:492 start_codon:yes stop_codon:yes gene_type:complete
MAKITNIENIEWVKVEGPGNFEVFRKPMTPTADACNLGSSLYRLAAGKTALPFHHHSGNDEAIYMLSGEVFLRLGEESHTLKAGDYVTFPAGTGIAHQISNRSDKPAEFLCLSTMEKTDVVFYPDSNKIGIMAGVAPGGKADGWSNISFMQHDPVEYWQGEDS